MIDYSSFFEKRLNLNIFQLDDISHTTQAMRLTHCNHDNYWKDYNCTDPFYDNLTLFSRYYFLPLAE